MSLYIALTGLKGAQSALSVTSNNIANANSIGFKKSTTTFADLVASSGIRSNQGGTGTVLQETEQQFQQGVIESTGNTFDLAISGQGFFATRPDLLDTNISFTRAGAYSLDRDNFVRGPGGEHLLGYTVSPDGRTVSTGPDSLRPLQLPNTSGDPIATSQLQVAVNLPESSTVIPEQPRYAGGTYAFDSRDPLTYNFKSPATLYDTGGNPQLAEVYYVRTQAPSVGDQRSLWNIHVTINGEDLTPADGNPIVAEFDINGRNTPAVPPVLFDPYDPGNGTLPTQLTLELGTATELSDAPFSLLSVQQDGFPAGTLDGVSIDATGLVSAGYSNGTTVNLGRVAIVNFSNPEALVGTGGSRFQATGESGDPQFLIAGSDGAGNILSGSIERANVDLTEELVGLIVAQRNFQANAKSIETDTAMTQSILQIRG
ncbi:flagellar hook protein FlgE [Pacificimonas sp. WHA3]|uniref:Flagellar hook protein FlgE n=1 Tax=Pacificimonas pallii TaxID=2827236 RepID=A0ABS6SF42_9SPHN|nr:flagellar hook protein FlgE [Pacificimonas pallii]MBV7257014.1 flagellar hook protein FlgE [Pacificimonas pallii]